MAAKQLKYLKKTGLKIGYEVLSSRCPYREMISAALLFEIFGFRKRFVPSVQIDLPIDFRFFLDSKPVGDLPDSIGVHFYRSPVPKNELVTILPGMFFGTDHRLSRYFCSRLTEIGYDVISFPSPFTEEFLNRCPFFSPGSFEHEAQLILSSIELFKQGKQYVKSHLIGASYGSFLSSVAAASDKKEIFDGKLMLVSPVASMSRTLDLIDELIQYQYTPLAHLKKPSQFFVAKELHQESIRFQRHHVKNFLRHQETGFAEEFHSNKSSHINEIFAAFDGMKEKIFHPGYERHLNLRHAFEHLTKENQRYHFDGHDLLSYWLDQLPTEKVRLVIAKNDPLIPFESYYADFGLPERFQNSQSMFIKENGSHGAFIVQPDFVDQICKLLE